MNIFESMSISPRPMQGPAPKPTQLPFTAADEVRAPEDDAGFPQEPAAPAIAWAGAVGPGPGDDDDDEDEGGGGGSGGNIDPDDDEGDDDEDDDEDDDDDDEEPLRCVSAGR